MVNICSGGASSRRRVGKRMKKRKAAQLHDLPDDILVNVLSHLGFVDAAHTSVLSSRWRQLWRACNRRALVFTRETMFWPRCPAKAKKISSGTSTVCYTSSVLPTPGTSSCLSSGSLNPTCSAMSTNGLPSARSQERRTLCSISIRGHGLMGHLLAQLPTKPFQKWLSCRQVSAPHVCQPVPAGGAA